MGLAARRAAARIRQLESGADASAASIQQLEARLQPITDLELETVRLDGELQLRQTDIDALRVSYADKKTIYDQLIQQVAIFDEKLSFAEMGVYEPHFDFTDRNSGSIFTLNHYARRPVAGARKA